MSTPLPKHYIKQGDTLSPVTGLLRQPDGSVPPLATAEVRFNMRIDDGAGTGAVVIDHGECEIVDEDTGEVRYNWNLGETAVLGDYEYEFEVDYGGGRIQTFPNTGNRKLKIVKQIA